MGLPRSSTGITGMTYGIKIAKPNETVDSTTDKLYVDSDTPLLKVFLQGSGTLTSTGSSTSIKWNDTNLHTYTDNYNGSTAWTAEATIIHGLEYVPAFMVFCDRINNGRRRFCTTFEQAVSGAMLGDAYYESIFALAFADTGQVVIEFENASGAATYPDEGVYGFYYYIFYDQVTEAI